MKKLIMKSLTLLALMAASTTALAQANDAFSNRTSVQGAEVSVSGSSADASKESGEPNHVQNAGGKSVWWSWTAPESGTVTVSTEGSDFDTILAVYTGNSLGNLSLVGENDDATGDVRTSAVTFSANQGTAYAIAVDGYDGVGGNVQLSIAAGGGGGGGGSFTARNATYNGLISNADELSYDTSGYITIKTTTQGRFTAKLIVGTQRYSASGAFDADGAASSTINQKGGSPAQLDLQVDDENDLIYGTLSDGNMVADVVADRASYDKTTPAPEAGQYTLILPGADDSSIAPGGTGVGTVSVGPDGRLKFSGMLADGAKITQSSVVSGRSQWPLYVPVKGGGSVIGWITFNPDAEDDIYGPITWFKTTGSTDYPEGFQLDTTAIGSAYQYSKGTPLVDWETGQLVLSGGEEDVVYDVVVTPKGQLASADGSKTLKLKITPKTGLVKGTISDPDTKQKTKVNAVVLQKQGYATGFYPGGNVYLGP